MSENNQLAIRQEPSLFNIATLIEANDFSLQMSKAKLIPAHLQGSPSDCLRVVMQAAKWGMDPFAVADKTSVISGKLMYEGQLVAAVINTRANLSKRLSYTFSGTGAQRSLVVAGTLRGETEPLTIDLSFSQACAINKNGQMQKNPDQQMCYIGARIWARRHMPELMLGVTSADEIPEDADIVNVTGTGDAPAAAPVADPVPQRQAPPPRAKKGAAAVVENKAPAIEVPATVVPEPAPEPVKAEPVKQAAPVTPPAVAPEPVKAEPAAATPRVFLKADEELTANCTIVKFEPCRMLRGGVQKASVAATVKGDFNGQIWHFGGADSPDITAAQPTITIPDVWKVGANVVIKLRGRLVIPKGADGKPDPTKQSVKSDVISIEAPAADLEVVD